MRMFYMGLAGLCVLLSGCSKSGVPKQQFPAHITGTVTSFSLDDLDVDPAPLIGIVEINASDGKTYHFQFSKVQDLYPDNCSMHLDTTAILSPSAVFADTSSESLMLKGCSLPNTIDIQFFDSASTDDTHGVKDLHATFTTDTKIWGGFNVYDNRPAFVGDRIKTINTFNTIAHKIKDANSAPGDQPARIVCQVYIY